MEGAIKTPEIDGTLHHPFTCIVTGPSQSGKSTFVRDLLLNAKYYIDQAFDYILIFIGTPLEHNLKLKTIQDKLGKIVEIVNIAEMFHQKSQDVDRYFKEFLEGTIAPKSHLNGCIIFDDLMNELGNTNFISDLFTKHSSHSNLSCILITQNLFHKAKNSSQAITLYRNTHFLVLFESFLDATTLNTIVARLPGNAKDTKRLLAQIQQDNRYVVLRGDFHAPCRISSEYFIHLDQGTAYATFSTK